MEKILVAVDPEELWKFKIDEDGYRTEVDVVEPERYKAAMMRHLCKYLRNPYDVDEESGLPHLWHAACNIAFLCELERGEEDEPKEIT